MNLLMLCREPRLYSCQRLLEAAKNSGHQLDILDPNRFVLKICNNQLAFFYQPKYNEPATPLAEYDGIIPRFGAASTKMGCAVLNHFHAQGTPCLNTAQAVINARDKWHSLLMLHQHHIPVPNSVLAGLECEAKYALDYIQSPTILKTLSGAQGIGVMLAEKKQSAVSILETLNSANIPTLLQDFISEAQSADIRCFVVDNRIIASMQRNGQNGEFRANAHRGGQACQIELSEQEKTIALQATQVLGLDVAGVDLIRSANGPLVLEVNASPGLETIERVSKIDIALQMIIALEKRMAQKSD
ncbi:ATP-grasp domain-containing protein [Spirabiliibacterium falconis]|uniref:ATP-grasp domain-containing protein n=1 Tax=Spirabiliibacterium falconis TaxID=572023 RepID=UPI001AAC8C2A|nr:RimK family alpha-L-glutamate ligase [Spirabiliibacterium falconis]MBE2893817.1 RimK family alpha-L-glutamate ligase [Spirabiliibacterium falconis]